MARAACRSEVDHPGPAGDQEEGSAGTAIDRVPPSWAFAAAVVGGVDEVVVALPDPLEQLTATSTRSAASDPRRICA